MREQITIQLVHNILACNDLIVSKNAIGKGIHFRLNENSDYEELCDGTEMYGSIFIGDHPIIKNVTVSMGLYVICALNIILGLEYPTSQSHFLVFVEKYFLDCHRSPHTPESSQLKKDIERKRGKKIAAASALDIDDSDDSEFPPSKF